MHRDIKCSNILISSNGEIKLTDFGVSTHLIIGNVNKNSNNNNNTNNNSSNTISSSSFDNELLQSLKGTIPWMAPEVICQKGYGKKADVWSLGCCLIEMLTAKNPWDDLNEDNFNQALLRIGTTNDIPSIPFNISSQLKLVLEKCLVRDPHQRGRVKEIRRMEFLK